MSGANRRLSFQAVGSLAFGSLLAAYADLLAGVQGRGIILVFTNSLNSDCTISFDNGTTDCMILPAGQGIVLDLSSNDGEFSGTIRAKRGPSGASTSGQINCSVIRVL